MNKALVTGAGGFVGTEVVKNLLRHGYQVRALVRKENQIVNLERIGAEVVLGDLNNPDSLVEAVNGIDKVFHIAALFRQAGVPDSEYFKVNVEGTENLLKCSLNAGVEIFIHCSTNGVHGDVKGPPANEDSPFNPGDLYQESKLKGELLVSEYIKAGKIKGSIIRPAMIYGKGDLRFLKLFKRVAEGRFFYVGKGMCLVHFLDVRDLADAFRLASEIPEANGEAFLIAGETILPLNQFVSRICKIFGVREPWLHLPIVPMQILGDICEAICTPFKINPPIFRRRVDFFTKNRSFDISKARKILKYKPAQSLEKELDDIVASYVDSGMISKPPIQHI